MNKYLVILAGSPRGGSRTWKSLNKYVLKHLNADLAICLSDKWKLSDKILTNAKYEWRFEDFSENLKYYEKNFSKNWKEYLYTGKDTGLLSSGGVHFVFKDYILRNYISILQQYDYIIYTRFDQFYTDFHPTAIKDSILIPSGEDYYGICDRHAMIPKKYIEKFLGICNYIDSRNSMKNIPKFNNCETTFKRHLEAENILKFVNRFSRSQFTATLEGEHTNWRVAKYKIFFIKNLMIKYPDEFLDSISNLISKKGIFSSTLREPVLLANYFYIKTRIILGKFLK